MDWVNAVSDHKLDDQHEFLAELLARSLVLLPPSLKDLISRARGDTRATGTRSGHR